MQVRSTRVEELPRLAWCADIDRQSHSVLILHGPDVETGDGFFCEGAWSGDFGEGAFERHQFMGSGGKVTGDGLLIATPNHTIDRIYVLRHGNVMSISNSCAFVLARAHDAADPGYLLYTPRVASIIRGLDKYARWIPTRNGNGIRMFCHCNLHVGVNHEVEEEPKPPVRDFVDFADYRSFLEEQVGAIVRNANDPRRIVRYRPVATVSSGYDSPASAVFARKAGCDEAITFPRARFDGTAEKDDSGAAIAQRLGMKVRSYDRLAYLSRTGFPEAEGGISEFLCLSDSLERRILFTGFNGDTIWDRDSGRVSRTIRRSALSGDNLAELRLRVGFIQLPVPYLGGTSHPSIYQISISPEMQPWRIRARYDKPIPRRVLEEAGVKRGLFAEEKKAVAIVAREEGFEKTMTPESFADFSRFVQKHWTASVAAKLWLYRGVYRVARLNRALKRKLEPLASRLAGRPIWLPLLFDPDLERLGQSRQYALLFHWSLEKVMPRYRVAAASHAARSRVLDRSRPLLVGPD
jgi:hypothetical protein